MAATLTRGLLGIVRPLAVVGQSCFNHAVKAPVFLSRFSSLVQRQLHFKAPPSLDACGLHHQTLLQRVSPLIPSLTQQPCRTITYYSVKKGKRKTVKAVVYRFLRLHCGLWVRRKAGYKKKLWKKSAARKKRLREHVFCNKTQCKKLDKMTTSFWKRRNWYLNDPYQKYHDRVNL
ncbi:39S ribosomal protein L35, mitochondrial [Tachysurus fulvidraco]|uniref:39S ribosomal protein L35, mitochondrial n=1 Tax=Tachysurus fulvidraco TaxID=1234273 RepID=UPI000F4DF87E|nr:39S ribosomal protein L35, mitochondrial [Tachysurus fulvidraco]